MAETIIITVLFVAVCLLAARLISLKSRISSLSEQLDDPENPLITTTLDGDELEEVLKKINLMKENDYMAKLNVTKEQAALKQAIADISHDIRTPLTSVVGYLQLAERSAENEEQRANIDIALERARYCSSLVNDFFELSVIDSNGIEPVMDKIDVNDMLCELILANYPNFEGKGVEPHFEDSGVPIYVRADRKMLTRVLQNLISNGIKYGSGSLDFVIHTDDTVNISVSNTVSEKQIDTEKMFNKFYRASSSRTANGAGIGLYICKEFMEAMGGNIFATLENDVLTITVSLERSVS